MILIDRDDVVRIGLADHPAFQVEWEVGSPEAIEADYADVLAEGPFLLTVNDECAWAGQHADNLYRVAQKRVDPINLRHWKDLADLYAAEIGISRQGLVLRFASIRRKLRRRPTGLGWVRWSTVYHWPDGSDLMWAALLNTHHPEIEAREHLGQREVRYAG